MVTNMALCPLFPAASSILLVILSGFMDMSSAVFLIFKLVNSKGEIKVAKFIPKRLEKYFNQSGHERSRQRLGMG